MVKQLPTLDLRTRGHWRSWLEKNHVSSAGVWLVYHKEHTAVESIAYVDSVCEALCFGWVDSLIKRIDDDRYARKFTPRKPLSKWSASNCKRWNELNEAGLLAAAGLAAGPTAETSAPPPAIPELPAYIAKALKLDPAAWNTFRKLAPSHRRHYVMWIHTAVRPETRSRRIEQAIKMLATGKKLGLK
jgi:uncharacterized protein YdeI (YjbR/CyaY-like superfamily)